MADEEKQEKEEKPKKQAKQENAEQEAEEPQESGGGKEKRNPKVTSMELDEVNKALEQVEKKMGGVQSRYARHLLAKKAALTHHQAPGLPKAA